VNLRKIDCVAIIGVGLIGGSFGMALRKRGLAGRVIGVGRNPDRLRKAVELGAVDEWTTDVEAGVEDADLIYVSTPVSLETQFIQLSADFAKEGCIITDAGSTKALICEEADRLMHDGIRFVGGHPMAGSEATGVEAATADLFVSAAYVLTPTASTDEEALAIMKGVAEGIGSRVIIMDAKTHDRSVAVISHLPHLIAVALVSLARERSTTDQELFELAAGSFRDITRVAGSSPVIWRDICLSNIEEICRAAEGFQRHLAEGLRALESNDAEGFTSWFEAGNEARNSLSRLGSDDEIVDSSS